MTAAVPFVAFGAIPIVLALLYTGIYIGHRVFATEGSILTIAYAFQTFHLCTA